jgi:hypothetical protein
VKQTGFSTRVLRLASELEARSNVSWLAVAASESNDFNSDNPYSIGGYRSFVPDLGRITWDWSSHQNVRTPLSARIFELKDRISVGYIRIPHYSIDDRTIEDLHSVILHFNEATDLLVLDQVNNPGGSLFHAYAVLSHITNRELDVPMHSMALDDDQVAEAEEVVWLANVDGLQETDEWPTPEIVAYSKFIVDEVKAGRKRRTKPGFVFGIDAIQPSDNPYVKPVIVLINEVTFSAPEFLAAIVQDNERGVLFGQRTAGAGGLMKSIQIPGSHELGIESMTMTWTLALRTNGQYIQNFGVQPDVEYSPTAEDIQGGYTGYRDALLNTVREVLYSDE